MRAVPGGGRRRTDAATHLTDHVLPAVPYRQWTFSLPKRLARDPKLLAQGLRRFPGTVFAWQRTKAKAEGISHPLTGSPSRLAKRFGGQLNLNVH